MEKTTFSSLNMQITIIGCGNMGLIYARAFLKYNIVSKENLLLVEKNESRKTELEKLNIGRVVVPNDISIKQSEVIILSVKPQDFNELSPMLKNVIGANTVVLSIMAGISLPFIHEKLQHNFIVRAMPNSPVEIGMGVTAYSYSKAMQFEQAHKIENLLATTGRTIYIQDEILLDAVTALSGSGPAYFFYFVQQLIEAGKKMGLDEGTSTMLTKQTMLGAFHLINNAGKSLDELIKAVASKGGTTEAALSVFAKHHIGEHLQEGLKNAQMRGKELSALAQTQKE